MSIATMTPEEFSLKFRDAIRVGFNWDRFFKEHWRVEAVILTSKAALADCFMPWYIGGEGKELAYDDPGTIPMCMTDVPHSVQILNEERQADIYQYVESFHGHDGVIEFSAPTYGLPDNQYFVLDRNHRLSALTLTNAPFRVTLWNVRGPLDPECLLDLIHWIKKK